MLIVLPPSETKAEGGSGASLRESGMDPLSFASLNPVRRAIAEDLVALCSHDTTRAREALGLSEKLSAEVEANAQLWEAPTMPAILRYTGVLFDALDAPSMSDAQLSHLAVGSALWGVVMAGDPIPHYRLSGGTKLPESVGAEGLRSAPTLKSRWGGLISDALAAAEEEFGLVLDLRSGTYQQLGKLKSAVTVRVESVQPDGSRRVVSHFNKHYKGLLARALLLEGAADAGSVEEIVDAARSTGLELAAEGRQLTLTTHSESAN